MPRQRLTTIVALMALGSCCALAPAASASSTLLSGYGGPGQGNQAILGSTLIGGSGGSGGGGGATSAGSAPQAVSIEAAPAPRATPRTSGGGASGAPRGQARHQRATGTGTSAGATAPSKPVVVRPASAPALGLSGTDIAYVVLGFLVLVLTAVVTVLLTRGDRPAQGGRGETDIR